jgi:RNA polymerase sigma factor (sigma-70 family)
MRAAKDKRLGEKTMYTEKDLYGIAGKFVHECGRYFSEEDQEDMKQEAVIAMWLAQGKADENRNPDAYVCRTGKGTALNTAAGIRKQSSRFLQTLNANLSEDDADDTEAVDMLPGREKGFVGNTLGTDIRNAIEALPESRRDAATRILIDGLTLEAYGQEAGFSKERARQILADATATLRKSLRDWESTVYA